MKSPSEPSYGQADATFIAAGGEQGIRKLVDGFYDIMASDPAYQKIYLWHPDETTARDKLARFLCGWMGGPLRYHEKYGSINIPEVHQHLPITEVEMNMWIDCMQEALEQQPYAESLKQYLIEQLAIPARRVLKQSRESNDK